MNLTGQIESLLLAATRPLTARRLAELAGATAEEVTVVLDELAARFNEPDGGIHLLRHAGTAQLVTGPAYSKMITEYLKEEQAGDLTRPSLETLTIIAYRGPISKIHLDTIRGVNCSLILRNLMIKGLVEAKAAKDKYQTSYQVTNDFVRFLGLDQITELPDYAKLNGDQLFDQLLNPNGPVVSEEQAVTKEIS